MGPSQNSLDRIGSPAIIFYVADSSFAKTAQMNLYPFGEYYEKVGLSEIGHVKPPRGYGYLPGGFLIYPSRRTPEISCCLRLTGNFFEVEDWRPEADFESFPVSF